MRRPFFAIAAFVFLSFVLVAATKAEVVDRIVAMVNNDVITQSELNAEAQGAFTQIDATLPPEQRQAMREQVRGEVLDSLIDKILVAQRAKELKLKVSEGEIDEAVQQVLERNKITKEQLLAGLAESGVNENIYRNTLRSQLLQNKLVAQELRNKVVITEEMARKEYQRRKGGTTSDDTEKKKNGDRTIYTLQQIGCRWADVEGRELSSEELAENKKTARDRIERVHRMAEDGGDFADLAAQYSDLPSAADRGNLGALPDDELGEDMLAAVKKLDDGEISGIIETPDAFQFFRLVKSEREDEAASDTAEKEKPVDDFPLVKEQIINEMYNAEIKKAFSDWAKELRENAYIRKM
ncbi:MAG: SurA N-terminal domain-containing protein [Desulfobulbaceae bacterium]|jgi:peptidyl-prolyl cis-trans isomerase SurA|nr:SurA N-terminal domain-containing protein [Desulfobulbaceae bacterium]